MNNIEFAVSLKSETEPHDHFLVGCLAQDSFPAQAFYQGTTITKASKEVFPASVGSTIVEQCQEFNYAFQTTPKAVAKRTVYFGLGTQDKLTAQTLTRSFFSAFAQAQKESSRQIVIEAPTFLNFPITAREFGRIVAEAATCVDYELNHRKTQKGGYKAKPRFTKVTVKALAEELSSREELAIGLKEGSISGQAINRAKDLTNEHADNMTPTHLAATARKIARESGGAIKVEVFGTKSLKRMKALALLAVGQGAHQKTNSARLIDVTYSPANAIPGVELALVGKSITFDSGGLNAKPPSGMRLMKGDMAGGAAVLAAISVIAALKLPIKVRAILAAAENAIGSKSYKPGATVDTMNGMTIEVDNTDAEGRVTLADAVEYAKQKGVTHIVDIATLTGAIFYALGSIRAGAFGNNEEFTALLCQAGEKTGERYHALPMDEDYAKGNESDFADLKNSGGDFGAGSITAAWFIRSFVGEEIPWVHLDIAAMSMKKGLATGFGVKTLVEVARQLSETKAEQ